MKKYEIFSNVRDVHLKFKRETHVLLKHVSFDRKLTITEIVEELCSQFVNGHPELEKIIDSYIVRKTKSKISEIDRKIQRDVNYAKKEIPKDGEDVLYRMIDEESPFNRIKNDNEDD